MATKKKKSCLHDQSDESNQQQPRKKRKLMKTHIESLVLKVPTEIKQAIQECASVHDLIESLVDLIAEYSFGFDDAIEIEFGGEIAKYNKLLGLKANDDERCYQFLKKHHAALRGMYPPVQYRQHGIFKQIWNDLPHILDRQGMDLYENGVKNEFESIIQKVAKITSFNEQQQKEVDQVWNYVKQYYQYACTATDRYMGSPYRCVWLPVGGILWNNAQQEATQSELQSWDEVWDFMCMSGNDNCIAKCGFYDTASREAFWSHYMQR